MTRRGGRYYGLSPDTSRTGPPNLGPVSTETLNDLLYTGATAGPLAILDDDIETHARKDDSRAKAG